MKKYVAKVSILISASTEKVWKALISPETVKKYMYGTNVQSSWVKGEPIIWKGEWKGNHYIEKGIITEIIPEKTLAYTRYNNLSNLPDIPENYNQIKIEIASQKNSVVLTLTEDNNSSEKAKAHTEDVWKSILNNLKEIIENN